ncbi:OmpA family protein [Polaromonas sp.]|uniref:OmpA family protein n=1 Tax=Polaromonas sp. TaxID=1869339 RepID=UPI001DDAC038|nr:OmpA family protein [Polaromonas sp.]MBT9476973.1 OmpA family protein [Polaromonas sp.]
MKSRTASGTLGLAAFAALLSPLAMAQDTGWYGGANVGQSRATIDDARIRSGLLNDGFTSATIVDDDRSTGFKIFGGYQLNKNFAVEGGYFDLGKFGYTATTVPPGTLNGSMKVRGLNLDLVGTLPVTEKFSVFGRVGVNYAQTRDNFSGTGAVRVTNPNPSKNATNYKFGAGLQYAFTDSLAMRLEGERYRVNDAVGNKGDVDLYSVGLIYRFGPKAQAPAPYVAAPAYVAVAPAPVVVAPPPPPPPPRFEKYTLSATELFAFDSAELRAPQPKLDEIASALAANSTVNDVVITGYTDRLGSNSYNQALSERRANAVKNYLSAKGVSANRLNAQGKGEANPVVECSDKNRTALIKCLEPNRRVEVEQITIERRVQ